MKSSLLTCVLIFMCSSGMSQQIWTLEYCLATGNQNSLEFQLSQLEVLSAETQQRSPLLEYLPNINLTAGHSYSIGSTIDPATNNRVSSNIQSDNFALNANINLLDFNVFTTARRNRLAVLKAKADKDAAAAEHSLSILENYFNALYAQELLLIQIKQLNNTVYNLQRVSKEAGLGSRPISDLYDIEVSHALEENSILETRQLLFNRKLQLIQMMNVEGISPDDIELDKEPFREITMEPAEGVFANALESYPAIKSATLAENLARKDIALQKNRFLPALSAYYNYSSFYYLPVGGPAGQEVSSFRRQLNDNKNHYIGLQLTIPVFNGLRTGRDVRLSKLEYRKRKLETEMKKLELWQDIQRETANLLQSVEMAVKLEEVRRLAEKSFTTTSSRFVHGLIDATVYTASKNQLLTAEYNLLKARYSAKYLGLRLIFLQYNRI